MSKKTPEWRRILKSSFFVASAATVLTTSVAWAKTVTINYWSIAAWSPALRESEQKTIDRFNAQYKGKITVKLTLAGDVEQKVLTAIAGGAAPDVFTLDRFKVGSYAAKNVLTNLGPYMTRDKVNPDSFFSSSWNEVLYGGKAYAIPYSTDSRLLYYNKAIFRQAGLNPEAPPKTWEELEQMAGKIDIANNGRYSRVGYVPHFGNWYFCGLLWAAGGELLDKSARKVTWDSGAGLKAATFAADMLRHYGGISKISSFNDFTGGKVGAMVDTPGSYMVMSTGKTKGFEYGVASPPRPAGLENDPVSWSGGFSLSIPRGAKHPAEAWTFIKYYCMDKGIMLQTATDQSFIPTLKAAAYDERFLNISPILRKFVEILPVSRFRPVIPAGDELWRLYVDEVANSLNAGKKSPKQILTETSAEAQKILDRAWSRVRNK